MSSAVDAFFDVNSVAERTAFIAVYMKNVRDSYVRNTDVYIFYGLYHIIPALCSSATVASSSAYHSSPKRRVSGSFRNLYTGSPSSLPLARAASQMLQR